LRCAAILRSSRDPKGSRDRVNLLVDMMVDGGVLATTGLNDDRGSSSGLLLQVHVSDANILDGGCYLRSVGVCLKLLSAGFCLYLRKCCKFKVTGW
jgi:hypothetical protein